MKHPPYIASALGFAALAAVSLVLWRHPLVATLGLALTNDAYTHILLILPLSATLVYMGPRYGGPQDLRIDQRTGPRIGVVLLLLGLLLKLAQEFVADHKMVVALGDNIIEKNIKRFVQEFKKQRSGAKVILKEVKNPKEYGVAEFKGKKMTKIVEKPRKPKTNFAVIGVYFYSPDVFEITEKLKPSKRGELEITDVNNAYLKRGELTCNILDGWWKDCGESKDALLEANVFVAKHGANHI